MRQLIEYLKDIASFIGAILFQIPNERYDRINGLNNDSYEGLSGQEGIVIEDVSVKSGRVRYSGAIWRAKLEAGKNQTILKTNSVVKIISAEGNTLLVKKEE